jgi:predicted nucleotidyltransferase
MVENSNQRVIKQIKTLLKKVNKKYKLEKAILFGSRARDDWLLTSDVDLMLVSEQFKNIPFTERMSEILIFWKNSLDLEVICYTKEEFEKKKKQLGIVQQAIKEGKELAIT